MQRHRGGTLQVAGERLVVPVDETVGHIAGLEGADGKLSAGDTITVNILGRNITAKIASFRTVKWETMGINFVMVFSPNTLEDAPHRLVTTLELPKGTSAETEAKIIQSLAERFPLVTAIKIGDIIDAAKAMLAKLMAAIQATSGFTLLIGAAVGVGVLTAVDMTNAWLEFENGAPVSFNASWDVWKHGHPPIELYGTDLSATGGGEAYDTTKDLFTLGAADYLTKPVRKSQLYNALLGEARALPRFPEEDRSHHSFLL